MDSRGLVTSMPQYKDLQAAAAKGSLPLRLRVANTELSTSRGLHWFTVAYQIQRLEVLARRSVATGAGKRRAVSRTTNGDEDCELISLGAPDASDDDDSLGGFISDDGSDWRAQVERVRQTDRRGRRPDMHHARIEAGLDPGAGADEASEDDVDMYDTPARSSHFVDDEASDEDDIAKPRDPFRQAEERGPAQYCPDTLPPAPAPTVQPPQPPKPCPPYFFSCVCAVLHLWKGA